MNSEIERTEMEKIEDAIGFLTDDELQCEQKYGKINPTWLKIKKAVSVLNTEVYPKFEGSDAQIKYAMGIRHINVSEAYVSGKQYQGKHSVLTDHEKLICADIVESDIKKMIGMSTRETLDTGFNYHYKNSLRIASSLRLA